MAASLDRQKRLARVTGLLAVGLLAAASANAAALDLRGGVYTDIEKPFVGVGFLSWVGPSLYFNPNVEYVFVENGAFGTLNFDLHYDLPTGSGPYFWLGGGLAIAHSDPDGPDNSDTQARANLLAGLGLRHHGRSVPYVQAKYITGQKEWVLAVGIRF